MKQGFWRRDRFAGLTICTLVIGLILLGSFNPLERSAYDMALNATSHNANPQIAIIAIDDASLRQLGAWPWPRSLHARLYDTLSQSGASVIAQSNSFFSPQHNPAQDDIDNILAFIDSSSLSTDFSSLQKRLPTSLQPLEDDLQQLKDNLHQTQSRLQNDVLFAQSLSRTPNTLLAMKATINNGDNSTTPNNAPLPAYIRKNILRNIANNSTAAYPLSATAIQYPIQTLATAANGLGIINYSPDADGIVRSEPLLLNYDNQLLPSIPLLLVARSLHLSNDNIRVQLGKSIELGSLTIKTDAHLQIRPFFHPSANAFSINSYVDVLTGRVPSTQYRGKIVLIGATARSIDNGANTAANEHMPSVLMLANSVSSILNNDLYRQPSWANIASWTTLTLVALYLILLLPRLNTGLAILISLVLFVILLASEFILLTQQHLWLPLISAASLLLLGQLLFSCQRCLFKSDDKTTLPQTSKSHRMLGLSLQGQGQLDAAFEKFKMLPANQEALDVLYNLALDFERQQQSTQAVAVYQYAANIDPNFRDLQKRLKRAQGIPENINHSPAETPSKASHSQNISSGNDNMLGRYVIEKELGKGAMGAVYLGKDPKIGRIVAIKTMALAQEYEGDELDDVKERFFREAETAGRLSHPNIVTIFDAGDENDLAYIAMEFIKGSDMLKYCKADALLPISRVLSVILRAADALDFAHKQNVVHRDIKPANLMYDADTDTLKITDFGIARITDSSKTKTGMVLGTPSYMSPEQLAGKKVDGRSDLFSLGVMMFQMLTGRLPFQGESMAALMYKIANENHPSPDSIRPELHRCTGIIINRALAKDREKRYKSGAQMAADLRKCMQIIAKEEKA